MLFPKQLAIKSAEGWLGSEGGQEPGWEEMLACAQHLAQVVTGSDRHLPQAAGTSAASRGAGQSEDPGGRGCCEPGAQASVSGRCRAVGAQQVL